MRGPPFIRRFIAMWAAGDLLSSWATGVGQCATTSFSGRAFPRSISVRSTPLKSRAAGVGQADTCQSAATAGKAIPVADRSALAKSGPASEARDVGHPEDEEPFAFMREADFRRAEESALNLAAQAVKVSVNPLGAPAAEHPADVLDEDEPRAGLDEDAARGSPEVALVVPPETLPGKAMRLAGYASNDAIHASTEASARDGSHIAPQRRRSHDTALHLRDQISDSECFPLHEQDWASTWDCQLDGPIKAATAGAEADEVEGT